ncbi:hypothetical protein HY030_04255, partial [Candidatus Gottesmanbacteria bacterium]|nr:hypothetical protein [Candidatus Gottesmanbacteria bacterium]
MPKSLQQLLFLAQLEEYDQTRLETWLIIHPDAEIEETKKHLVWTPKARIIFYLGNFFFFFLLYPKNALFLGLNIISLPENLIKKIVVLLAAIKLSLFPKLLIIAITGSFGKTSVKEILYQVLSSKYQVL